MLKYTKCTPTSIRNMKNSSQICAISIWPHQNLILCYCWSGQMDPYHKRTLFIRSFAAIFTPSKYLELKIWCCFVTHSWISVHDIKMLDEQFINKFPWFAFIPTGFEYPVDTIHWLLHRFQWNKGIQLNGCPDAEIVCAIFDQLSYSCKVYGKCEFRTKPHSTMKFI